MKVLTVVENVDRKISYILQELMIYYPSISFNISAKEEKEKIVLTVNYSDGPIRAKVRVVVQPFISGLYTSIGANRITLDIERDMSPIIEASLLAETNKVFKSEKTLRPGDLLPTMSQTAGAYIRDVFRFRDF